MLKDRERKKASKLTFGTLDGSSRFRVMRIEPDSNVVAPYLCVCEMCLDYMGSCSPFKSIDINSTTKKHDKSCTRKDMISDDDDDDDEIPEDDDNYEEIITDYLAPNTAIAAGEYSKDMFYFIFAESYCVAEFDMDDFNHQIVEGQSYISGYYLEKKSDISKGITYTINTNKRVFFFPESIVYPFVNFMENSKGKKNTMFISNEDFCEVLCFVEKSKMSAII